MKDKLRQTFEVMLGERAARAEADPPPGGFFCPNFVSDQLMRELSLPEQSVLWRLLRLAQAADRSELRLDPEELAAACGLTPTLAARAVESLEARGLLRALRAPLLRQWRLRLRLDGTRYALCAVCHGPLGDGETVALAVAETSRGLQTLRLHRHCLAGRPLVPAEAD